MRRSSLVFALFLTIALAASTTTPPSDAAHVDFDKQIAPILKAKCQPCHYPGGVMYAKRPFDRPSTIVELGEKLFTRIKDEEQRKVIRAFLVEHQSR